MLPNDFKLNNITLDHPLNTIDVTALKQAIVEELRMRSGEGSLYAYYEDSLSQLNINGIILDKLIHGIQLNENFGYRGPDTNNYEFTIANAEQFANSIGLIYDSTLKGYVIDENDTRINSSNIDPNTTFISADTYNKAIEKLLKLNEIKYTEKENTGCLDCAGLCKDSCFGECAGGCGTTCQDGCMNESKGSAGYHDPGQGSSNSSSGVGCPKGCDAVCDSGCTSSCYGGCQGGCKDECKGDCKDACYSGCTNICVTTLDGKIEGFPHTKSNSAGAYCNVCGASCTGACETLCNNGCREGCTGECSGSCDSNCYGGCSGNCTSCNKHCGSGCTETCYQECGGTCNEVCVDDCQTTCIATCGGTCSGHNGSTVGYIKDFTRLDENVRNKIKDHIN